MSVFVDTGVLYADHDTSASRHEHASSALEAVYNADFGQPYVSDYIYDEAVTLTLVRGQSFPAAKELGKRLRGSGSHPSAYEILRVSPSAFDDAVEIFERYHDQELSFTDATNVALCARHGIDAILSFDDDLDGVVSRIDPTDL